MIESARQRAIRQRSAQSVAATWKLQIARLTEDIDSLREHFEARGVSQEDMDLLLGSRMAERQVWQTALNSIQHLL